MFRGWLSWEGYFFSCAVLAGRGGMFDKQRLANCCHTGNKDTLCSRKKVLFRVATLDNDMNTVICTYTNPCPGSCRSRYTPGNFAEKYGLRPTLPLRCKSHPGGIIIHSEHPTHVSLQKVYLRGASRDRRHAPGLVLAGWSTEGPAEIRSEFFYVIISAFGPLNTQKPNICNRNGVMVLCLLIILLYLFLGRDQGFERAKTSSGVFRSSPVHTDAGVQPHLR